MASYAEIRSLFSDDQLRLRTEVAVLIAAHALLSGAPTGDEQKWAAAVFADPKTEGTKAFRGVLAANVSATVIQIVGASDSALQANVDSLVPSLVVAFNAV